MTTSLAPEPHATLRARIHHILATTRLTDPGDIAKAVLEQLDADEYVAAVEEMLREFVRQIIHKERTRYIEAEPDPTESNGTSFRTSWRRRGVKEQWEHLQRNREYLPSRGTWILLGDATKADLLEMAEYREAIARANKAKASEYRAWATAVESGGVSRFGDLPLTVVAQLLKGD